MIVIGPSVALSVIANDENDRYKDPETDQSGPILLLTVGIFTFIFGLLTTIFGSSIAIWMVDPRVLESNGNIVGLIYPTFAADTSKNPDSL